MKFALFLFSFLSLILAACTQDPIPDLVSVEKLDREATVAHPVETNLEVDALSDIKDILYIDGSYLLFLDGSGLKRYDVQQNTFASLSDSREPWVRLSSYSAKVLIVEFNDDQSSYRYAFFDLTDPIENLNFSPFVAVKGISRFNGYWVDADTFHLEIYHSEGSETLTLEDSDSSSSPPSEQALNIKNFDSVSADGKYTAYIDIDECSDGENLCPLKIGETKGLKGSSIVDEVRECTQMLWSPTGRYLAYTDFRSWEQEYVLLFDRGKKSAESQNLSEYIGIQGGQQVEVLGWPDAEHLLFQHSFTTDQYTSSLWSYDLSLHQLKEISFGVNPYSKNPLLVSPDLTKMAFIKSADGLQELWIADSDGTDAKMIHKNY